MVDVNLNGPLSPVAPPPIRCEKQCMHRNGCASLLVGLNGEAPQKPPVQFRFSHIQGCEKQSRQRNGWASLFQVLNVPQKQNRLFSEWVSILGDWPRWGWGWDSPFWLVAFGEHSVSSLCVHDGLKPSCIRETMETDPPMSWKPLVSMALEGPWRESTQRENCNVGWSLRVSADGPSKRTGSPGIGTLHAWLEIHLLRMPLHRQSLVQPPHFLGAVEIR